MSNFLFLSRPFIVSCITDDVARFFGEEALRSAIVEYSHRHRRFGGLEKMMTKDYKT